MSIEWVEPPPKLPRQSNIFTAELLGALKAHPGQWALIQKGKNAPTGSRFAKEHPDFEVTTRSKNGVFDIYARYVGDES